MRDFLKNNWQLIVIEALVLTVFCLFYGRFGDINVDSFREAYIPQEILNGKSLYKNILCIYSPLGYFINAFLYMIFGVKLCVLYFAGLFTTCGILYLTHKISEHFFDKFLSFSICLLIISAFVLSPNVFNPFLPYSFGLLYGIFFILCSVYFSLKENFPLSYLFYSLAVCSKYELIFILPLLVYMSDKKDWIKNLTALILPVLVTISVLFITGTRTADLITSFGLMKLMSHAETLKWIYASTGLVFRPESLLIYLESLFKFLIPYKYIYQEFVIWAFPLITILFFIRFKTLEKKEKFVILCSVLASLKVFFGLTLQSYGVFFIPFVLISLGILIPQKCRKILAVYFILWSLIISFYHTNSLLHKNFAIKTEKGLIKTNEYYGKTISDTINFAKTTPKDAVVVVMPEGLSINYLADRKTDDKFYSLIPLNVEILGDENIIKRLEITKPEYIVITNYDTSAYYYRLFGYDYAEDVYKYITKNYRLEKNIGTDFKSLIYKIK